MKGLLIIPAYNEEENIGALLDELDSGYSAYDYIVVNDGSRDATRDILRARHAPYLDLPVNLGIGGGVQAGYLYAQAHDYDIAVQMDGDGQHLPAYLDCLIAPLLADKADFVVGSRYLEHEGFQSSRLRRAGGSFLSRWLHSADGHYRPRHHRHQRLFVPRNRKGIALALRRKVPPRIIRSSEALTLAALCASCASWRCPSECGSAAAGTLLDLGRSLGVLYDQGDIWPCS